MLLAPLLALQLSCESRRETGHNLEGQWRFRVSHLPSDAVGTHPAEIEGILVFDKRLPTYGPEIEPKSIVGRAFIDLTIPIRPGETRESLRFGLGDDADLLEEVNATVTPQGRFVIEFSPQVFGRDPIASGQLHGSTASGRWIFYSHADTIGTGTFTMRRIQHPEARDSAIQRARRASSAWGK